MRRPLRLPGARRDRPTARRCATCSTCPKASIYLDGNSLGALPKRPPTRGAATSSSDEWGEGLIRSWNSAGWIDAAAAHRRQDRAAGRRRPGEVIVADSTSVNLYKVLACRALAKPSVGRALIVSERSNFPTDLYIADSARAASTACELKLVDGDDIASQLDDALALLMLTHVNYRSGRMHDMAALTRAAHAAGALIVWDLAHSAGARAGRPSARATPTSRSAAATST